MEPEEYKTLVSYKLKGEYPAFFTEKEKFIEGNNSNFVVFINVTNSYIKAHTMAK